MKSRFLFPYQRYGSTRFIHWVFLCIVICFSTAANAQLSFSQSEIPAIANLSPTSIKPGDFDSDGDLDLLVQYYDTPSTTWKAQIFENTSVVNNINFVATAHIFSGAADFIEWMDFNKDGSLDIFVNGNGVNSVYLRTTTGYINSGTSTGNSAHKYFEIVDKDNNAELDIEADKAFLDYDKDGDLDYFNEDLFTNRDNYFQKTHTFIDGGSTHFSYARLQAIANDFDNNGYLDIAYIENDGKNSALIAYVLLNDNSVFTKLPVGYYPSYNGGYYLSTSADFNGNGYPELVLYSEPWLGSGGQGIVDFVEIKNGAAQTIHSLAPPANSFHGDMPASCSGDFDGDGKVDLIGFRKYFYFDMLGNEIAEQKLFVYRNTLSQSNTYATAPTGLGAEVNNDLVTLSWNLSSDDHTVTGGITYNVEIKNGVDQVVMGNRTPGGNLKINKLGNVNQANKVTFRLPNGQYTWSVSAIDGHRIKSTRSAEGSFEILKSTNAVKSIALNNTTYGKTVDDRIILTGDEGGAIYFQVIESNFGSKINLPVKVNTSSTLNQRPRIGYNAVGEQFMIIWWGSTPAEPNKLWGRVFDKNGVALSDELLISDPEAAATGFSPGYYDVCYNKAKNNYRVAWTHSGLAGEIGIRSTTISASNFAKGPIAQYRTRDDFSNDINYFDEVRLSASTDGNSMLLLYSSISYPLYGVLSEGRFLYMELLDANFVNKRPQIMIEDALPNSLCYNTLNSTFGIGWEKYQYRKDPNSASAIIRNSEVKAGILHISDGSPLHVVDGLSSSFIQGGSGGAFDASIVYNSIRNEFLMTWYNSEDSRVHGRRINPITRSAIEPEEFIISNFSGSQTQAAFIPEHNQFALSFGDKFSMFTLPKDAPPVVSSISEVKASVGTKIIITGRGFGNTPSINAVKFGGFPAVVDPVFAGNDPTKLQVTVPPGLQRTIVPVTVSFDDQLSNATVLFENIDNTSVTSVAPLVGALGETITITGVNFPVEKENIVVKFGNEQAAIADVVDNSTTEIKVKVPQNAVRGSGQPVSVVIQGVPNTYAGGTFRVIRPPVIETVTILGGSEFISGTNVQILGQNFSDDTNDLKVKIGNFQVHRDSVQAGNNILNFKIPLGAEGNELKFAVYADDTVGRSVDKYKVYLGSEVTEEGAIKGPREFEFSQSSDDNIILYIDVYSKVSVKKVNFWTKGISEKTTEFKVQQLTEFAGNTISHKISESNFTNDPIGLEAFFEVVDKSDSIKRSDTIKVYRNYPAGDPANFIPDLRFGGNVSDYQIVSIPYKLDPDNIPLVFKSLFDEFGYDISKWRIFHYETEQSIYREYSDGLNKIEPGKGYWLISRYDREIFFDGAKTLEVTDDGYYEIPLHNGWNQIGNPFNFNISWDDVLHANEDATDDMESLRIYEGGTWSEGATIDRFRGGFVKYNGSGKYDLKIPVTQNKDIQGGRKSNDRVPFASRLDAKEWRLALDLSAGDLKNRISSFGMHPQADEGVDQRDQHKLPAFIHSLDLSFPHSLSTSIVGTDEYYTWDFDLINTTDSKEVTMTWDNTSFGDNDRELYLQDNAEQRLIDMRKENHYTFTYRDGYSFKIHFGDKSYIEEIAKPSNVVLSDAYPNPMNSLTRIPFTITKDKTHVRLGIYSLQGQEIQTLVNTDLAPGFYEFEWDAKGPTGEEIKSGVVIYRLQASESGSSVKSYFKKLVIKP